MLIEGYNIILLLSQFSVCCSEHHVWSLETTGGCFFLNWNLKQQLEEVKLVGAIQLLTSSHEATGRFI